MDGECSGLLFSSFSLLFSCPPLCFIWLKWKLPCILFVYVLGYIHITWYIQKHVLYGRFKGVLRVILIICDFESLECDPRVKCDSHHGFYSFFFPKLFNFAGYLDVMFTAKCLEIWIFYVIRTKNSLNSRKYIGNVYRILCPHSRMQHLRYYLFTW
jgi:hypothetical protein